MERNIQKEEINFIYNWVIREWYKNNRGEVLVWGEIEGFLDELTYYKRLW